MAIHLTLIVSGYNQAKAPSAAEYNGGTGSSNPPTKVGNHVNLSYEREENKMKGQDIISPKPDLNRYKLEVPSVRAQKPLNQLDLENLNQSTSFRLNIAPILLSKIR